MSHNTTLTPDQATIECFTSFKKMKMNSKLLQLIANSLKGMPANINLKQLLSTHIDLLFTPTYISLYELVNNNTR